MTKHKCAAFLAASLAVVAVGCGTTTTPSRTTAAPATTAAPTTTAPTTAAPTTTTTTTTTAAPSAAKARAEACASQGAAVDGYDITAPGASRAGYITVLHELQLTCPAEARRRGLTGAGLPQCGPSIDQDGCTDYAPLPGQ